MQKRIFSSRDGTTNRKIGQLLLESREYEENGQNSISIMIQKGLELCPYCVEGWVSYSEFLLKNQKFKTTLKCVKNCISDIEKRELKEKTTFEELKKNTCVKCKSS